METLGTTYFFGTALFCRYGCHFCLLKSVIPNQVSSTFMISLSLYHSLINSTANCYLSIMFLGLFSCIETSLILRNRMPICRFITSLISQGFASNACSVSSVFFTYSTESITTCFSLSSWTTSSILFSLYSLISL